MSSELFGPILPILKMDFISSVDTISSMLQPLALYIFSEDEKELDYILNNTLSGDMTINETTVSCAPACRTRHSEVLEDPGLTAIMDDMDLLHLHIIIRLLGCQIDW
jgi:acyl-CoA reductase-like NAD-dependent aldehyde dehydrogenase